MLQPRLHPGQIEGRAAQKPDAAFKAEIPIRQGADRADIGDIAGIGIGKFNARENTSISLRCPRSMTPSSEVLEISRVKRTQRVHRMHRS